MLQNAASWAEYYLLGTIERAVDDLAVVHATPTTSILCLRSGIVAPRVFEGLLGDTSSEGS